MQWSYSGLFSCTSPPGETSDRWSCTGSLPARLDSRQVSPHPFWSSRSSWCSPCRRSRPLLLLSCCSAEKKEKGMWTPQIRESAAVATFNSCDLQISVRLGAQHGETLGGAARMSVHCYRDKDTPVLWVSGGKKSRQLMSSLWRKAIKTWKVCETFHHKGISLQTYFKSSSFDTAGFKFVEVSIEQD